jgi:hypothetical protein
MELVSYVQIRRYDVPTDVLRFMHTFAQHIKSNRVNEFFVWRNCRTPAQGGAICDFQSDSYISLDRHVVRRELIFASQQFSTPFVESVFNG